MSSRAGRAQRGGRGIAAASVATFVATVSHAAVSAQLPPVLNIALALCLAAPVCVALAGRALSWWRLSTAVVLSQALFHALLTLDLEGGGVVADGAHHGSGAMLLDAAASTPTTMTHTAHSAWMWVAHAVAAVITILALGRGERAVRAIARFVGAAARALGPVRRPSPAAPAVLSAPDSPLLPTALTVLSPMRHRGPPRAA
ncbi:MAG: ribosomal protein [Microbacterium sp.]|nr:ribosomal protein [Microbacterium sp.]